MITAHPFWTISKLIMAASSPPRFRHHRIASGARSYKPWSYSLAPNIIADPPLIRSNLHRLPAMTENRNVVLTFLLLPPHRHQIESDLGSFKN
jgi:hypothetical protein